MTNISQTAAQLKPQIAEDPWAWTGILVYQHHTSYGYILGLRKREPGIITAGWTARLASARDPACVRRFKTLDAAMSAAVALGLKEVQVTLSENLT